MPTARLTISRTPNRSSACVTPLSTRDDREAIDRAASIIRRYATSSVAIAADATLSVDLNRVPWACDTQERSRRLGQLVENWTGRKVEVAVAPGRPGATPGPFSVDLRPREGESPAVFRARIARAGERLAVMAEARGSAPDRWLLQLDRQGSLSTMPLPAHLFDDGAPALDRRLPDAALAGITAVRIDARARRRPAVHVPGTHTRRPAAAPGNPRALPLVS